MCAEQVPQHSGSLQEVIVVIAPKEQEKEGPGALRECFNTLVCCLPQSLLDISNGLLCDSGTVVAPYTKWPMNGGGLGGGIVPPQKV